MVPHLLRRAVWASSVPPWLGFYRAYYWILIRVAVQLFRRYPGVKAVYLRGGAARGEIVPLVSDLDFVVITSGMERAAEESLRRSYRRLARVSRVLDSSLALYDEEELGRQARVQRRQYWLAEGMTTWKLLHGSDCLRSLAPLPGSAIQGGIFEEIKVWWTVFARQVVQVRRDDEPVPRNVACYKAVSEVLKLTASLRGAELIFGRREALRRARPHLQPDERIVSDRLEALNRSGYRSDDPGIAEATKDLLVRHLNRCARELRDHALGRPLEHVIQRIDGSPAERLHDDVDREHLQRLLEHVRSWDTTTRRVHLATGLYFDLNEWALLIEVDAQRPPSLAHIRDLWRVHANAPSGARSRVHPYLLLPDVALQIDADYRMKAWQSVLCPAANPEIFAQLGAPEFAVDGGVWPTTDGAAWTPLVAEFLRTRKALFLDLLGRCDLYRAGGVNFSGIFWKTVQLALVGRSIHRGEVLYPLTIPAIERALQTEGIQLPRRLERLAAGYSDPARATSPRSAPPFAEALAFVTALDLQPSAAARNP